MQTKFLFGVLLFFLLPIQLFPQFGSQDSGGPLTPEWAAYDVKFYNINLNINPDKQTINGWVGVTAEAIINMKELVLDLDDRYRITKIVWDSPYADKELNFKHENGKIKIQLPEVVLKGKSFTVKVYYNGKPRVAQNPPWDDGFVWSKTKDGEHWIGVACQGGGADTWWPCKDHPSDEPDSVLLNWTVPGNLICASNGKLRYVLANKEGTKTFSWFVSTPINNYGISIHAAPYDTIQYKYTSVTGEEIPVTIWVLPENMEKARAHCPEFLDHLRFYEELLGPYPFRADKYGVAETPYLGMEHQTIIANGYGYRDDQFGFDWLHHHELGHEWWGNMVTAKDWSDFWIHEAVCGYMQTLYLEDNVENGNPSAFLMNRMLWKNEQPIAPRKEMTSTEAYTNDMYSKGSYVLHTLRYYVGDETFKRILRRWAYPDPEMEEVTDGSQCRFATTDEFLEIAEKVSGRELDWFWEVYFRQASLPVLKAEIKNNTLYLEWEIENDLPFSVPVEVKLGDEIAKVEMREGAGSIKIPDGVEPVIDPGKWITMAEPGAE
ncbi:MAG TPA: M1 family metallopeptidase [Ignavibacteriaceae bacterium]|nr:M1 family metallopeptidase [Ignavibacteriaceae bacterium]